MNRCLERNRHTEREREREREREGGGGKERDRQTDRRTERQTDKQIADKGQKNLFLFSTFLFRFRSDLEKEDRTNILSD